MSFQLELSECIRPLGASLTGDSVTVKGVSIDSRTLKPGELYVAIVGERFNGHEFVNAAKEAGAAAIMVHEEVNCELPQLGVADTQLALGQLGKFWAARFAIPTVAITGSNGKTTVKEIVTSILQQQGPVLATRGNLNNELGVPLTLLNMRKEHDYAVIEMGANHAGEIARLVALVEPDVAVVTNIGTAHLEGFGSVEGIAAAKSEIYAGLKSDGYGVINADDAYADFMRGACEHCRSRDFGRVMDADVSGAPGQEFVIDTMGRRASPRFRLAGEHNFMNALAAVAAAQCLDVQLDSIVRGLEAVSAVPGRLEKKSGASGALIIDDSYNANPDSVRCAINVLAAHHGKQFLVLGDMGELGPDSPAMHSEIGRFAREQGVDGLWTTGDLSCETQSAFQDSVTDVKPEQGAHFKDQASLISNLLDHLSDDVTVLIKGSRSAHMENVVNALVISAEGSPEAASTGAPS
ncbi:MAG: UDP-N-acetylmuramoyl-tripeptide--D-alanyl-D-alanine ligase [Granulosicoccus sp.]